MKDDEKPVTQTETAPAAQSDTNQNTDTEQKKPVAEQKKPVAEQGKPAEQKQPASAVEAPAAVAEEKSPAQSDTDDGASLREENARLQEQVAQLQVAAAVTRLAQDCGVDPKAVPYVSKLIDLSAVVKDGKCDDEKIKRQIDKLLTDLPQLKLHLDADDKKRVTPIGVASGASNDEQAGTRPVLAAKKWNRFNN